MDNPIKLHAELPGPETRLLGAPAAGLDRAIKHLETFFRLLGFYQHPLPRLLFSWALFLLLGVSVPLVNFLLSSCSSGAGAGGWSPIVEFDACVMASQASLAAVSLLCVSHNLRKYGVRKLLFVGKCYEGLDGLHGQYVDRIKVFFRAFFWVLPGFITKTAREIICIFYVHHESQWQSVAMLLASVLSWTYLTVMFLSGCNLFSLACNLQVIHFEQYGQLLQNDTEVSLLLEEHTSLCYYLSKISHRFRIHLLLVFFICVTSQFITLLLTTQYGTIVDFINAGDFAVCAAIQVIGIVICLNAATRISHRAQSLASLASRWHVLATCRSSNDSEKIVNVNCKLDISSVNQATTDHPGEGIKSSDIAMQGKEKFLTFASLQYQRQALVMYLQSNNNGITIYGWAVDRGLINTIFAIELSLLLFVFGRTL
uniref:Uncharacterized protein n=1 Tax=Anthurium amnicola TaxID=1678845 RepID=A0A1D1ZKY4_9ARAE